MLHCEVVVLLQKWFFFLLFAGPCRNIWTGAGCWKWDIRTSLQGLDASLIYDAVLDKAGMSSTSEDGQHCSSNSLVCLVVFSVWCKMVSPVKLCAPSFCPVSCLFAAMGRICVWAFILTSLCPGFFCPFFSFFLFFLLFQNYLGSGWHKLTSVVVKLGLDWVENSAETTPALPFKAEVSVNPALWQAVKFFDFLSYLCCCDITAQLTVKKLQQWNCLA